ncbi:uncharacterized protein LOC113852939 [Abrus precatorius]|uniref:Uncharacterized protein LOC113852939 n=1 Tax=Abrus precatorius TaxID=3816 RepID=A0A8B8K5V3_ABRPR|nr:uncharacterized protein LOC113852939 [Abrus precatorius]
MSREVEGEIVAAVPVLTRLRREPEPEPGPEPEPDPFLSLRRCFSFVTAFSAFLCVSINLYSAFLSFNRQSDVFYGIFRCYAVFIGGFVILAETDWDFIIKFSKVLENWVGRGMVQIFVAVMTRAIRDYCGEREEFVYLQSLACYMLFTCGVISVLLGIVDIGFLKSYRQTQEISREQATKDLEELERRREELQRLLV